MTSKRARKGTTTDQPPAAAPEAAPAPMPYFIAKARYREVVCRTIEPAEGRPPLTATIRANLTVAEIDAIPLGEGHSYNELWDAIARFVVAWNATAVDLRTGEERPVPPPAELGRDAFRVLPLEVGIWLGHALRGIELEPATGDDTEPVEIAEAAD
jgi:hypothetical protein